MCIERRIESQRLSVRRLFSAIAWSQVDDWCIIRDRPTGFECNMTAKKPLNLEKSLAGLESLVEELEGGELPLDKAMQKFEEGVKLTRECQAALKEAEQKVEILLQDIEGEETLQKFDSSD